MPDAINAKGVMTSTVLGSDRIHTSTTNDSAGGQHVDALCNILESLGMPNAAGGAAATTAGGLTLANFPAVTTTATAGPPLSELASSSIINKSGILNNPSTVACLVALHP